MDGLINFLATKILLIRKDLLYANAIYLKATKFINALNLAILFSAC